MLRRDMPLRNKANGRTSMQRASQRQTRPSWYAAARAFPQGAQAQDMPASLETRRGVIGCHPASAAWYMYLCQPTSIDEEHRRAVMYDLPASEIRVEPSGPGRGSRAGQGLRTGRGRRPRPPAGGRQGAAPASSWGWASGWPPNAPCPAASAPAEQHAPCLLFDCSWPAKNESVSDAAPDWA